MVKALSEYQVVGLATNVAFLKRLVEGQPFAQADLDTGLIERHHASLFPPAQALGVEVPALAAAALLMAEQSAGGASKDPWADLGGWRLNGKVLRALNFTDEAHAYPLIVEYRPMGWDIALGAASAEIALAECDGHNVVIKLDGATVRGTVVCERDVFHVFSGGAHYALRYNDPLAQRQRGGGRRRRADRANAGQDRCHRRRERQAAGKGRAIADHGGDEDGTYHCRSRQRHGTRFSVRGGRSGQRGGAIACF